MPGGGGGMSSTSSSSSLSNIATGLSNINSGLSGSSSIISGGSSISSSNSNSATSVGAKQNNIEIDESKSGPYVDKGASKNVTALLGKTAYLTCRVKNIGNKTVSGGVSFLYFNLILMDLIPYPTVSNLLYFIKYSVCFALRLVIYKIRICCYDIFILIFNRHFYNKKCFKF